MSINVRGSAEYLGGCMMSVSWHCIKPQERPDADAATTWACSLQEEKC